MRTRGRDERRWTRPSGPHLLCDGRPRWWRLAEGWACLAWKGGWSGGRSAGRGGPSGGRWRRLAAAPEGQLTPPDGRLSGASRPSPRMKKLLAKEAEEAEVHSGVFLGP